MTVWVYGDSNSLGFNLDPGQLAWPDIVAKHMHVALVNRAKPGVDNFFIYQSWLSDLDSMAPDDWVIMGWSHYSRKMFLCQKNNPAQQNVMCHSIQHVDHGMTFMRSRGPATDEPAKYLDLAPKDTGLEYFDHWFRNYYHAYEHQINLQSYIDSVEMRSPQLVQFYFSRASLQNLRTSDRQPLCMLDFLLDNKLNISDSDCHASVQGHAAWARSILERINERNHRLL